jgi:hypothetical protein
MKHPEPELHPQASATERALFVVAQHLRHAQHSHEQALRLQAQGEHEAARSQSRMTRVFLHNALHRIDQHAD